MRHLLCHYLFLFSSSQEGFTALTLSIGTHLLTIFVLKFEIVILIPADVSKILLYFMTNSLDPDLTPQNAASDQGLNYLSQCLGLIQYIFTNQEMLSYLRYYLLT